MWCVVCPQICWTLTCWYLVSIFQFYLLNTQRTGSWSHHGAHLGPVGPRWAPCWPHQPCYQGKEIWNRLGDVSRNPFHSLWAPNYWKHTCYFCMNNNNPIRTYFCTCQNNRADMTCTKLWLNSINNIIIKAKRNLTRFELWIWAQTVCKMAPCYFSEPCTALPRSVTEPLAQKETYQSTL